MRYQKVYSRLWTETRFRSWGDDVRAAALYLLTCPHRNTEGLFRLPLPLAAHDLGWTTERTTAALDRLQRDDFIDIDGDADLIWLVEALEWDPPVGPKQIKGAVRALAELPPSRLRSAYLRSAQEVCPALAAAIEEHLGWVSSEPEPTQERVSGSGSPQEDDPPIAPSPSRPPSRNPTTPPRSTQEGPPAEPGGVGSDDGSGIPGTVELAHLAHKAMGYPPKAAPSPKLVEAVRTARGRGWTPNQVLGVANEATTRPEVQSPAGWMAKKITSSLPPRPEPDEFGAKPIGGPPPVGRRRVHDEDCPGGCSDEGWVDGPDGLVRCTGQPIEASA